MSFKPPLTTEGWRELDAVMAYLVSVFWLEPEEPSNPAKRITIWIMNALVRARVTDRIRVETQRRADASRGSGLAQKSAA